MRKQDNKQNNSQQRLTYNSAGDLTETFFDFDTNVADDPLKGNFRHSYSEYDLVRPYLSHGSGVDSRLGAST
ncbi:MAG: hypothetical protein R3C02_18795 [Planctomycetaceae bacterium]